MKELSIEEKASRYDEAIERAKEMIKDMTNIGGVAKVDDIQYLFPELKESEDERIRGAIIDHLKDNNLTEWAAWLEKQGIGISKATKKKLDDNLNKALEKETPESWSEFLDEQSEQKPKFRVGDTIKCKHDDRIFTIKSVDLDKGTYTYTQEGCGNDIDYADEMFELVEQKPADKVEPKFKVGDLVRRKSDGLEAKVINVSGGNVQVECSDWREIILVKEWELVEQKPAWSEEDEDAIGMAIIALEDMYDEDEPNSTYGGYNLPFNKAAERLKSLKDRVQPKQEWSVEDDILLNDTIYTISEGERFEKELKHENCHDPHTYQVIISWLKSLKDRVIPQKQ